MFTIIGGDGKEYGPATAEQLRQWITAGRANLDTKAKALGTDEWRRLGDFAEFSGGDVPPPIAASAPAPAAGPKDIDGCARDLIARAGQLDVFGCLDRSFTLWKQNFLPIVGATLLVMACQMLLSLVPILGAFAGVFLTGVFNGGLYYFYIGKLRGQPREIGDSFAGFSKAFVPLMLAGLLTTAIIIALAMVCIGPAMMGFITAAEQARRTGVPPEFHGFSGGLGLVGLFIVIIAGLYLSISWSFTFALVIDKGLGPWTAMEVSRRVITRQWFRVFAVAILGGILAMLGLLGLVIGFLFTLPLAIGAIMAAYESLCNPPPAHVPASTPAATPATPAEPTTPPDQPGA
ncbi:MAG: DUF4339 domain-containing protein [Verrucomicrobia bacterium]|nr:DUF4339 domain-containing protein [Verrucomicrobiota bacterium]